MQRSIKEKETTGVLRAINGNNEYNKRNVSPTYVMDGTEVSPTVKDIKDELNRSWKNLTFNNHLRSGLETMAEVACQVASYQPQKNQKIGDVRRAGKDQIRKQNITCRIDMLERRILKRFSTIEDLIQDMKSSTQKDLSTMRNIIEESDLTSNRIHFDGEGESEEELDHHMNCEMRRNRYTSEEQADEDSCSVEDLEHQSQDETRSNRYQSSRMEHFCWNMDRTTQFQELNGRQRSRKTKRKRDNWTEEENRIFLSIASRESGFMDEMELRRMLTREFAPRRTHEQCANHLRILRSQGKIPPGKAIVKRSHDA